MAHQVSDRSRVDAAQTVSAESVGGEEQDGSVCKKVCEVAERDDPGRIKPMEVLDRQHQGATLGLPCQGSRRHAGQRLGRLALIRHTVDESLEGSAHCVVDELCARAQTAPAFRQGGRELGGQPRLACAGVAGEQHEAGAAVLGCRRNIREQAQLFVSLHQRR